MRRRIEQAFVGYGGNRHGSTRAKFTSVVWRYPLHGRLSKHIADKAIAEVDCFSSIITNSQRRDSQPLIAAVAGDHDELAVVVAKRPRNFRRCEALSLKKYGNRLPDQKIDGARILPAEIWQLVDNNAIAFFAGYRRFGNAHDSDD